MDIVAAVNYLISLTNDSNIKNTYNLRNPAILISEKVFECLEKIVCDRRFQVLSRPTKINDIRIYTLKNLPDEVMFYVMEEEEILKIINTINGEKTPKINYCNGCFDCPKEAESLYPKNLSIDLAKGPDTINKYFNVKKEKTNEQ